LRLTNAKSESDRTVDFVVNKTGAAATKVLAERQDNVTTKNAKRVVSETPDVYSPSKKRRKMST
jgi:limonene-1,2-epoxide hydrolase